MKLIRTIIQTLEETYRGERFKQMKKILPHVPDQYVTKWYIESTVKRATGKVGMHEIQWLQAIKEEMKHRNLMNRKAS